MKKYIIFALVVLVFLPFSLADAAKSLPELVDNFFEAVKAKDRKIIEETYKALSENEEVLELTKKSIQIIISCMSPGLQYLKLKVLEHLQALRLELLPKHLWLLL